MGVCSGWNAVQRTDLADSLQQELIGQRSAAE